MTSPIQQNHPLPLLREDLHIRPGPSTVTGEPSWVINDPVRNQYFQIGWGGYQIISRWQAGTVQHLMAQVRAETTYQVTEQEIQNFIGFVGNNHLTKEPLVGGTHMLVSQAENQHPHWWQWLIHQYLFIRIPLCRPDHFLKTTLPWVTPLGTKTAGIAILLLGTIGLYLVSRQWETFLNTFVHLFSWQGMVAFGIALGCVKVVHELGHAYTATHFGCRIQTMGVALLVMFPVLYTDTSEAWRLTSRTQRLRINAAGVMAELAIALLAIFAWNFMPEGILKSIVFILATTSWVISLSINFNPLLRFDGYYMLGDWLGIPNLQQRSFHLGRWKLREWLWGFRDPSPEHLPPGFQRGLILYAWSAWIFRLVLFVGIALLVYHFFFKLLGIILFAIEIIWFILMPMAEEVKAWWNQKDRIIASSRLWGVIGMLLLLTAVISVPWNTRISLPAVLQATHTTTLYTPVPAQIVQASLHPGQWVQAGDPLIEFMSPGFDNQIHQTQQHIDLLRLRLQRRAAHPKDLSDQHVLKQELDTRRSELQGLMDMKHQLQIQAPFSGKVTDVQDSLHEGRWVTATLPLATLIQPDTGELLALSPETEVQRLSVGQVATFIPNNPMRPILKARVQEIRQVDEGRTILPYFASIYGGTVPVRETQDGQLLPESAMYRVNLTLFDNHSEKNQVITGIIQVNGPPKSLLAKARDLILPVLIRELGF